MVKGVRTINGRQYTFDSTTGNVRRMYASIPYYNQRDARWGNKLYGRWYFSGTGCVPTAGAMVFSFLSGTVIRPDELGDWAYIHGYLNRQYLGCTDTFWPSYASATGRYCKGNLSMQEAISEMRHGRLVVACMDPGTFTFPGSTHEIVLYSIDENNMVDVYDPYFPEHNGKYPISLIYDQLSTDPIDRMSGGPIFAIG